VLEPQEQMAMIEPTKAIKHSPIQAPTIFWTDDSIFCNDHSDPVWKLWKQDVRSFNKHCKIKRILDVSGKRFVIDRFEEIPPKSSFAALWREKYWQTWFTPIIVSEKQLSLEEFKKEVLRAVKARYRHDKGSMIVDRTLGKLPHATTYLEAIESLPKLL
jgi:hypothetical protein